MNLITTALFLFLFLTGSNAVQIRFFRQHRACNTSEPFYGCDNIGPNTCCSPPNTTNPFAVSVAKASNNVALTFRGAVNNCRDQLCSPTGGQGNFCCIAPSGTRVSGASFYNSKKRGVPQTECTVTVETNVIGFSNGTHGVWKLGEGQVSDRFERLKGNFEQVPDDAKLRWLQAHHAVYEEIPQDIELQTEELS